MKLNHKRVLLVGFGFLIIQAFWAAYDAIVPLMLVNKFGMNQTWSGVIMTFDNVLAVFMLPLFGNLSDKSKSRMGKRKPFVLIGTICAVVAFFGLSFVDYAQLKNLGEQAQTPNAYESTVQSIEAQQYFWEQNYEVLNKEHNEYKSEKLDNGLPEHVKLQDYVSYILYNNSYESLTDAQKQNARDWYLNIDLNTSFLLTESGYKIFKFTDKDTVNLVVYSGDESAVMTELSKEEGKQATSLNASNAYSVLVSSARSAYAQGVTTQNPLTLVLFMAVLLLTLVAMAIFRSPAVALMPDVVVRPLRSKANALINLMGGAGSVAILALGMIIGTDKVQNQVMPYMSYIGCVCIVMVIGLIVFMLTVKEPKWSAQMLEDQERIDAKEKAFKKKREEVSITNLVNETAENEQERERENEEKAVKSGKLTRGQLISLILILASVAFWYMGYNAVTSKYSLYAINVLGKPYNIVLIVAQVVGAISFIPIGMLGRIGRKKMILIGVVMLLGAFIGATFVHRGTEDWVLYVIFSVAGVGWAAINVNSFPMVVELASSTTVGKFTGYYYTASMAAQILTPILSGVIMDLAGSMEPLFVYGAICVGLSFVTMFFVRHGDSKPIEKKSALEYLGADND